MPSKGLQGGRRAWDAPGGGRTYNPDGLKCPGPCAAWNATSAGTVSGRLSSLARPRELEAIVKDVPQGGSQGPQEGLAAFLGPGSSGGHLAASRSALCCSGFGAARCHGGPQALLLHPGVTIRKNKTKPKTSSQLPPAGVWGGELRVCIF